MQKEQLRKLLDDFAADPDGLPEYAYDYMHDTLGQYLNSEYQKYLAKSVNCTDGGFYVRLSYQNNFASDMMEFWKET